MKIDLYKQGLRTLRNDQQRLSLINLTHTLKPVLLTVKGQWKRVAPQKSPSLSNFKERKAAIVQKWTTG